jgi:hypothetical protein
MKSTIILADYVGRLGNRLYLFIHVLAVAMEHGFHVCNLTLQPHASWFENLSRNSWCRFPAPAKGYPMHRWVRAARAGVEWLAHLQMGGKGNGWMGIRTVALKPEEHVAMESPGFLEICRNHQWVILWGWFFRADFYLQRHQRTIQDFLRLRRGLDPELEAKLVADQRENVWQIALHIRQGDFRTWNEGKYYIPPEVFARHAWRLYQTHPDKKIRFWVCSDEPVDLASFPRGTKTSPQQTLRGDLRIMTSCDFILSGSSTLARSAAFLGGARLHNLSLQTDPPTDPNQWSSSTLALTDPEPAGA